jgi:PAS domain S-box-containing protein
MAAEGVHHTIETLQREVEALRSAVTTPAQSQGVLLEALGAFRSMLAELHVAEAALRDSEARSTAILQTAVDGIITIDEHGMIASFNPAAEHLFGYTADEVVGHNVNMLMPSPYREEHDGYLARYLQTGERKIIGIGREVRARRRDGTTFPMALAVSEVLLDGRRMFTGIVHDLSARVQAEEALRYQAQLLELSYEPIFVCDREHRIVLWNQGCERLYGFTKAEAVGRVNHVLPAERVV